jgi:ABC-type glycerol-3-phosphate transport system permease component
MHFKEKLFSRRILYVLLVFVIFISLFPIVYTLSSSFKSAGEMFDGTLFPKEFTLRNYVDLFNPPVGHVVTRHFGGVMGFLRMLLNTAIYAVGSTVIALPMAILAAYVITRIDIPYKGMFMLVIVTSYMIPTITILVPLFQILKWLKIYNTYIGLILAYQAILLPTAIWMLSQYFTSIPRQIEEAARIDGCSWFQTVYEIIVPIAAPGISAVAIYCLIIIWQEFIMALVLVNSDSLYNIQVGLNMFTGAVEPVSWGTVMTVSIVVPIPVTILFSKIQKYMVSGLTAGAIKG